MTPKATSGESPFSLPFGIEAILLPKMVFPTLRTNTFGENNSEEVLRANLDLLEERRVEAHLRTLVYKKVIARLYNQRVRPRPIKARDLVLQKTEVSNPTQAREKLAPNWECLYRINDVV